MSQSLMDIEEILPGSIGEAAAISNIVILQSHAEGRKGRSGNSEKEICVLVDRLNNDFLAAVNQIEGVTRIRTDVDRGYPLLRIRASRTTSVLSKIEALSHEQQIWVLDVIKRRRKQPTFTAPARLEAISKSQAVMELLRRFQGGYRSALLQDELGGSSTRLFMELANLVGRANCYRLFVGPLHNMADHVCGLMGTS